MLDHRQLNSIRVIGLEVDSTPLCRTNAEGFVYQQHQQHTRLSRRTQRRHACSQATEVGETTLFFFSGLDPNRTSLLIVR
jgi:hypothetical protein